jgi:hypothetical protein
VPRRRVEPEVRARRKRRSDDQDRPRHHCLRQDDPPDPGRRTTIGLSRTRTSPRQGHTDGYRPVTNDTRQFQQR